MEVEASSLKRKADESEEEDEKEVKESAPNKKQKSGKEEEEDEEKKLDLQFQDQYDDMGEYVTSIATYDNMTCELVYNPRQPILADIRFGGKLFAATGVNKGTLFGLLGRSIPDLPVFKGKHRDIQERIKSFSWYQLTLPREQIRKKFIEETKTNLNEAVDAVIMEIFSSPLFQFICQAPRELFEHVKERELEHVRKVKRVQLNRAIEGFVGQVEHAIKDMSDLEMARLMSAMRNSSEINLCMYDVLYSIKKGRWN
ncbi:MAG TPA: hypothetical protein VEF04_20645 [Blastocatellia bacterium]|nr:hypothetical protein [Blastocatellia bacterium]